VSTGRVGQALGCRFVGPGGKPEKPPGSLCHPVRLTRPDARENKVVADREFQKTLLNQLVGRQVRRSRRQEVAAAGGSMA
jgi:hypothetical protein